MAWTRTVGLAVLSTAWSLDIFKRFLKRRQAEFSDDTKGLSILSQPTTGGVALEKRGLSWTPP